MSFKNNFMNCKTSSWYILIIQCYLKNLTSEKCKSTKSKKFLGRAKQTYVSLEKSAVRKGADKWKSWGYLFNYLAMCSCENQNCCKTVNNR